MKKTVSLYDFRNEFEKMNRQDSFSYEGKKALFDYFEMLENDCGMEIELDIIAFCCEYTEYANIEEVFLNYFTIKEENWTEEEYLELSDDEKIEKLQEYTQVIIFDKGIIVQDF